MNLRYGFLLYADPVLIDIILGFAVFLTLFLCVTFAWHIVHPVPFVPTPYPVIRAMIRMAGMQGNETVYDLGAGDGRLLQEIMRTHSGATAIGCEVIPTVWLLGMARRFVRSTPYRLKLKNALKEDVSKADRVFLYLFPSVMADLAKKFDRELRPGTIVISNTFKIPGKAEEARDQVRLSTGRVVTLYHYRW